MGSGLREETLSLRGAVSDEGEPGGLCMSRGERGKRWLYMSCSSHSRLCMRWMASFAGWNCDAVLSSAVFPIFSQLFSFLHALALLEYHPDKNCVASRDSAARSRSGIPIPPPKDDVVPPQTFSLALLSRDCRFTSFSLFLLVSLLHLHHLRFLKLIESRTTGVLCVTTRLKFSVRGRKPKILQSVLEAIVGKVLAPRLHRAFLANREQGIMEGQSNTSANGTEQSPSQNIASGQNAIAHQVAQQSSNGNNGLPQQPLASNSPAPQGNTSSLGSNINNQNGALNGTASGSLACEWVGCGQRALTAEALYVREISFLTFKLHMIPSRAEQDLFAKTTGLPRKNIMKKGVQDS